MVTKFEDITGRRIGRLVVLHYSRPLKGGHHYWFCRCDCGTVKEYIRNRLTNKKNPTESCGCIQREWASKVFTKHGGSAKRIYKIWTSMKQRCLNKKSPGYKDYGGRGITVCDRWVNSFAAFVEDMGDPEQSVSRKWTLERIDNEKGYSPDNCKWIPLKDQPLNTRRSIRITYNGQTKTLKEWCNELKVTYANARYRYKKTGNAAYAFEHSKPRKNHGSVFFRGECKTLSEWAAILGLRYATIVYRLNNGWEIEKALTTLAWKR